MGEFIVIQVGQCGNQIGSVFWSKLVHEYNLTSKSPPHKSMKTFFNSEKSTAKLKARAILIDMEDSVLARFRNGPLKKFVDHKNIVSNYPGSGNNWAEGFCNHGPHYKNEFLNVIRRSVEQCDALQGFLLLFSASGGTGSGVGSFVLKLLTDYFPEIDRFVTAVYPLGTEDVVTCPYNMALTTQYLIENATCVFPVENRALLDIIKAQLREIAVSDETLKFFGGCQPYEDVNSIISNMLLHLTSGTRYAGKLNLDLSDIATNMVPFPKLNFLSTAFSPLSVTSPKIMNSKHSDRIKNELFLNTLNRNNQLIKLQNGTTLAATLLARGDFTVSETQKYVIKLQERLKFTPWSRKTIKIGLCDTPPKGHQLAMMILQNTTAMSCLFNDLLEKFNKLYKRKAHLHHYVRVDGFEEEYFQDCRERLLNVVQMHNEIDRLKPVLVPRLTPNR